MSELTVGELFRRYRKERYLTQTQVARFVSYNHSTISRIENNEQEPSEELLEAFCQQLSLSDGERQALETAMREEAVEPERVYWGMCEKVQHFYGRHTQISTLRMWTDLKEVNLIAILGFGGLGKTYLATQFAAQYEDQFANVVCCNLTTPIPAINLVHYLTTTLGDSESELHSNLGQALLELLQILVEKRCLIILDNFEAVLDSENAGKYLPEFRHYQNIIDLLGNGRHASYILLTSRQKPDDIRWKQGENDAARLLILQGLTPGACRELLQYKDVRVETDGFVKALSERSSGNPKVLELIADLIHVSYQSNVEAYLNERPSMEGLDDLLREQLEKLTPAERGMLFWLAIERQPLTSSQLSDRIKPTLSSGDIARLGEKLQSRSLIFNGKDGFFLQNVVMEFLLDYLKFKVCDEIESGKLDYLRRFALLSTHAAEFIQEAQRRELLRPITRHCIHTLGSHWAMKSRIMRLLEQLRHSSVGQEQSFAAGNLVDLLITVDGNLNDADLSKLSLRQVDFRESTLRHVNLQQSTLLNCLFHESYGHVLKVSFSLDGRFFAGATANGEVHIWQQDDFSKAQLLQVDDNWVRSYSWHPTLPWLATASSGQHSPIIQIWDVENGMQLSRFFGHQSRIRSICYSRDGRYLFTGSEDESIKIWDCETQQCVHTLPDHDADVWAIAAHPTKPIFASGGADNTIRIWDESSGSLLKTLTGHKGWVTAVAFNGDGTQLASASLDGTAKLWHVDKGQPIKTLEGHEGWVRDVAFWPEKQALVTAGSDQAIRVWSLESYQNIDLLSGHTAQIESIAVSPNGALLISGGADQQVRLWQEDGGCLHRIQGYKNPIWSVQFSPNGRYLLSGSSDGTVRQWDVETGAEAGLFLGHADWAKMVAYHPNAPLAASGSSDHTIRLWQLESGREIAALDGHTSWVSAIAFAPDGNLLASSSGDQTVRLWDLAMRRTRHVFGSGNGRYWMVAFSPNGELLAASNDQEQILIWHCEKGDLVHRLEGHTESVYALTFSTDGKKLYSGGADKELMVWDVVTGQRQRVITLESVASIWSIATQPNGPLLAVAQVDGNVHLIDEDSFEFDKTVGVNSQPIWQVAFSPDGQRLAGCGDGEKVWVWDVATGLLSREFGVERPYEGMRIDGIKGISSAQIKTLRTLGAIAGDS